MFFLFFSRQRSCSRHVQRAAARGGSANRHFLFCWASLFLFAFGPLSFVRAACGEGAAAITQELVAEEEALRTTIHTVRSSKTRLQTRDAELQDLLAHPPPNYDPALARRVAALRHTEVDPKRHTLENLRAQHEESRQQWERGHHLLGPQLAEARTAFQAKTITREEFCRIRETHQQALHLYLQGMRNYRRGMDLYAHALDVCADRFLALYIKGFTEPRQWEELIAQLQRGDFLHDILVPMTANVIRSPPPDASPE